MNPAPKERSTFVLLCRDAPETTSLRQELLAAHLDFVANNIERYLVAGPLSAAQGKPSKGVTSGSLFVVFAEDGQELVEFMSQDPYYASELYEQVEVFFFKAAAGSAVGGCTWLRTMAPARESPQDT